MAVITICNAFGAQKIKSATVSDSVRPHRWQPTRLPLPWDSPGKNTGVGCHFLLQCMKVKSESEVTQSCPTLRDPMDCMQPTRLLHPREFPGKSTGVGCHCLLLENIKCLFDEGNLSKHNVNLKYLPNYSKSQALQGSLLIHCSVLKYPSFI